MLKSESEIPGKGMNRLRKYSINLNITTKIPELERFTRGMMRL